MPHAANSTSVNYCLTMRLDRRRTAAIGKPLLLESATRRATVSTVPGSLDAALGHWKTAGQGMHNAPPRIEALQPRA